MAAWLGVLVTADRAPYYSRQLVSPTPTPTVTATATCYYRLRTTNYGLTDYCYRLPSTEPRATCLELVHVSLYLPISPYISIHLPISPYAWNSYTSSLTMATLARLTWLGLGLGLGFGFGFGR